MQCSTGSFEVHTSITNPTTIAIMEYVRKQVHNSNALASHILGVETEDGHAVLEVYDGWHARGRTAKEICASLSSQIKKMVDVVKKSAVHSTWTTSGTKITLNDNVVTFGSVIDKNEFTATLDELNAAIAELKAVA